MTSPLEDIDRARRSMTGRFRDRRLVIAERSIHAADVFEAHEDLPGAIDLLVQAGRYAAQCDQADIQREAWGRVVELADRLRAQVRGVEVRR